MTTTCAIYTRISDDREGSSVGVQNQEEACRTRAKAEGWTVSRVYTDNDRGASSKSKKTRPEYTDLLAEVRAGRIDKVVCYSTSRLTRRPREFEDWLDLSEQGKVRVAFVTGAASDWTTSQGRAIARTLSAFDAAEAEQISERVSFRLANDARAGKRHSTGKRAFGWQLGGITPETLEAIAIADATKAIINGDSLMSIVRTWNGADLRTSQDGTWQRVTVKGTLLRPANAGLVKHRGELLTDDQGEYIKGQWTPLVSVEDWQTVCAILNNPERRSSFTNDATHLGSGIAICGLCQSPMFFSTTGRTENANRQYRCRNTCSNSIQIKFVDEKIRSAIVQQFFYDTDAGIADEDASLTAEYAKLNRVREARQDILGLITSRVISAGEATPQLSDLAKQDTEITEEINRLLSKDADSALQSQDIRELVGGLDSMASKLGKRITRAGHRSFENLGERWDAMPVAGQRRLARSRLNVVVNKGYGAGRVVTSFKNGKDYSSLIKDGIKTSY